jgi:hypothetical protein
VAPLSEEVVDVVAFCYDGYDKFSHHVEIGVPPKEHSLEGWHGNKSDFKVKEKMTRNRIRTERSLAAQAVQELQSLRVGSLAVWQFSIACAMKTFLNAGRFGQNGV